MALAGPLFANAKPNGRVALLRAIVEVRATPQFFVNGKPLTRFGYRELIDMVEDAIALAY